MPRLLKKTLTAALALVFAGGSAAAQDRVVVFAAASLKNAFDAIALQWKSRNGAAVQVSYASSAALARQIDQGAPAGIFVSADTEWMDWLSQRNLIRPETRRDFLRNRLALIAAADVNVELKLMPGAKLAEALGGGRLAVGEVNSVPAGKYAKEALQSLGLWSVVADRLAQAENVRAALAFVARGEAPLGIVYETDARAEPRVKVVDVFPASSHRRITYPLAITAASHSRSAAAFLEFLRSPVARRILEAEGFTVID